jgi:hypothetical protein
MLINDIRYGLRRPPFWLAKRFELIGFSPALDNG